MITFLLIGFTVLISLKAFKSFEFFSKAKFSAYECVHGKSYERLISHLFVHVSWEHLIFNMLTLYFFGRNVEAVMRIQFGKIGIPLYLTLYIVGGIVASLYSLVKHKDNPNYSAVGASGAVSAILFAGILFNPLSKIYLFFIPIGIPAYIFGPLYLFYSGYMAKKSHDNIGHDAHFWGAVFGFIFPILLNFDFLPSFIYSILG